MKWYDFKFDNKWCWFNDIFSLLSLFLAGFDSCVLLTDWRKTFHVICCDRLRTDEVTAPVHWLLLLLLFPRISSLFPTISSLCCPSLSFSVFQVFLSCLFVMDCVIPIRLGAARAVGSVAFVKDWRAFKRKKKEKWVRDVKDFQDSLL